MTETGDPDRLAQDAASLAPLLALLEQGRTVLAPTAQISTLLADRVSRHHARRGRGAWKTPAIADLASWVRSTHERQWFDREGAPRVLEEVEERLIWRELLSADPPPGEVGDLPGVARAARVAWRAMREYAIAPASLGDFPGAESEALLRWSAGFQARCRELDALPAYELLGSLRRVTPRPVPLESMAWRPAALNWLGAHADEPLQAVSGQPGTGGLRGLLYPTGEAELAGCARWLSRQLVNDAGFRALVIVPDLASRRTRLTDTFDAALVPGRFSLHEYRDAPAYAIAGGVPLVEFAPVRLALESTRAMSGACPFREFSALMRDPALQAGLSDADATARLDRELRMRCAHEASSDQWLRWCVDIVKDLGIAVPSALSRLRALREGLQGETRRAPMSHWARLLVTAWEAGPWMNRADWSSTAWQAAERLRDLLHEMARANGTFGSRNLAEAVHIVTTAARETSFQPQTGAAPVWISSQLADPWLDFDAIWVASAGTGQWPPPPQPLPLLPVALQRRHGIETASASGQWQQTSGLQDRWRARTRLLTFSGVNEGEADAETLAGESPHAVSFEPAIGSPPEPLWQLLAGAAPALQDIDDEIGPRWDASRAIREVKILASQSRCPFRGFADAQLGARPLDFPEPGFSPGERGSILHDCLERLWGELQNSQGLARLPEHELKARINTAAEQSVLRAAQRRDPGLVWRRREQRRLADLLPRWFEVERKRPAFAVENLELRQRLILGPVSLSLRIDRIDRLPDGRLVLLDYKSGPVGKDWTGERPDSPQLPAYALCVGGPLAAVAYAQVNGSECRFMGISHAAPVLPKVDDRYLEATSLDGQLALWRERLTLIAQELHDGIARVAPTERACQSCSLQAFCRIDAHAAGAGDNEASGQAGE